MLTTHQTLLQIKNITEPDKRHSAAISQSRASRAGTGQFDDQGARLPVESSHPSITLDGLTRKNCIHDRWAQYYTIPHTQHWQRHKFSGILPQAQTRIVLRERNNSKIRGLADRSSPVPPVQSNTGQFNPHRTFHSLALLPDTFRQVNPAACVALVCFDLFALLAYASSLLFSYYLLREGPLSAGTASIRVKVLRRTSMSLAVPALSFNML